MSPGVLPPSGPQRREPYPPQKAQTQGGYPGLQPIPGMQMFITAMLSQNPIRHFIDFEPLTLGVLAEIFCLHGLPLFQALATKQNKMAPTSVREMMPKKRLKALKPDGAQAHQ